MRKFTQFIRSEKETRLDVHCFNLKGREGKELYGILKNMEFTFCYVEPDSILAFVTGEYFPRIKEIMKRLEKCYGFTWPEDQAIIGVSDDEMNRDFFSKSNRKKKKEVKKMERYCLYCGETGNNIGQNPCRCSPIGSHRIVIKGEKKYRFRKIENASHTLLSSSDDVPEGYELIETFTY